MLAGLLLAFPAVEECTPARWRDPAPETLELLRGTPINCLLAEEPAWRRELIGRAHEAGMLVLASVRSGDLDAAAGLWKRARTGSPPRGRARPRWPPGRASTGGC